MNATVRSFHRAALVVDALIGGVLTDGFGIRWTLWIAAVGLLIPTLALTGSGFRPIGSPAALICVATPVDQWAEGGDGHCQ